MISREFAEESNIAAGANRAMKQVLTLVGNVAVRLITDSLEKASHECALFSIAGLKPKETCSIAHAIASNIDGVEVHISPGLDDGSLHDEQLSEETAAHWRNCRRGSRSRAIVFAVPTDDLNVIGETLGSIWRIATDTLLEVPERWMDCTADLSTAQERDRIYLGEALSGLIGAQLVIDLQMFADFMLLLADGYRKAPVEQALDRALPALRLPKGAGRFKGPGSRGRVAQRSRWIRDFVDLESRCRHILNLTTKDGAPIDRDDIREKIDKHEDEAFLDNDEAETLRRFIADATVEPGRWTPAQQEVVEMDWNKVEPIFRSGARQAKRSLGQLTIEFFELSTTEALPDDEHETLKNLKSDAGEPTVDEREFFEAHRQELQDDKVLYRRWEKYIFSRNERCTELLSGLTSGFGELIRQMDELPTLPRLYVRLTGADQLKFWSSHNTDFCRFLRDSFRGLDQVVAPDVILDLGMCWRGENPWEEAIEPNNSASRPAREFKFELAVFDESDLNAELRPKDEAYRRAQKTQVIWAPPAESIARAFWDDLDEVANLRHIDEQALLLAGEFARNPRSDRSYEAVIRLEDRVSLVDADDKSEGNLVNTRDRNLDMGRAFRGALKVLTEQRVVSRSEASAIRAALAQFQSRYTSAVRGLLETSGEGLANDALISQAEAYGELLSCLRKHARAPRCRSELWQPILRIGVAQSRDEPRAAIVTPWQPLRLAELGIKARQFAYACRRAFQTSFTHDVDSRVFFETVQTSFGTSYYPDVALYAQPDRPSLLVSTRSLAGYDLLEPPTIEHGGEQISKGYAKEAAESFLKIADEYLMLQPHERANFSAVLYNTESSELPATLTERLARRVEKETDLRCDLILTHEEPQRLQEIYAEQNVAIGHEIDSALSTEATRTFLARLRVGFIDVDSVRKSSDRRRDIDLLLLPEVIMRNAKLDWEPVVSQDPPSFIEHNPTLTSRHRILEAGADSTAVFLTTPSPPLPLQQYLDILRDLLRNEKHVESGLAPVRKIVFASGPTRNTLDRAHQIAEWVVTFDGVADRRLLENNGIRIIRHLTRPGGQHNLIVSTKVVGRSLEQRLENELSRITSLSTDVLHKLVQRCLDEAARISGHVVLQAARRENNALELVGLVLSQRAARLAWNKDVQFAACLFLDDFAGWLGHQSGHVADLLLMGLQMEESQPTLELVVVESKFVGAAGYSDHARKARKQLDQTMEGLRQRLEMSEQGGAGHLIWNERLADLLLEHGEEFRAYGGRNGNEWIQAIRSGNVSIKLSGHSFVFVHESQPDVRSHDAYQVDREQRIFDLQETALALRGLLSEAEPEVLCPPADSEPLKPHRIGADFVGAPITAAPSTTPSSQAWPATGNSEAAGFEETVSEPPSVQSDPVPSGTLFGSEDGPEGLPLTLRQWLFRQARELEDDGAGAWLDETVKRLRSALRDCGMTCEALGSRLTPNAALVRFRGTDSLTAANIRKRQEILLSTYALRVIEVFPDVGEVVVMVAREQRAILRLSELWLRRKLPSTAPNFNTNLVVGAREQTGDPLYLNVAGPFDGQSCHSPHTLIAGTTGSGKSILVQSLILDICATNSPAASRIILIDPKMGLDYHWVRGLPHLEGDVITEREEAVEKLRELVEEMERRNRVMASATVSNVTEFNERANESERLPILWVVHDEFADWMKIDDYRQAVEEAVDRLGIKARAAGIHLMFVAQRPDKQVFPMHLRDNLGNRLILKVAGENTSKIALGEKGAERLLGRGHLAAKLEGEPGLVYAQVPFIAKDDIRELVAVITQHWSSQIDA